MKTQIIHTAINFPGEMIQLVFMMTSTLQLTCFSLWRTRRHTFVAYMCAAWEK